MLPGRDPASAAMAGLSISPEGLEAGTGTGSMAGTMAGAEGWAAVDGLPPPGAAASVSSGVARVTMLVRCENVGHGEAVFLAPSARGEDEDEDEGAGRGAAEGGTDRPRMIPLYTTAAGFPWFATRTPLHLPLSGSTLGSGAGGGGEDRPPRATPQERPQGQGAGLPPAIRPGRMGLPLVHPSQGVGRASLASSSSASASASAAAAAGLGSLLPLPPPQQQQQQQQQQRFFRYRYAIYRAGRFHRWEDPSDAGSSGASASASASASPEEQPQQAPSSSSPSLPMHCLPLQCLSRDEQYAVSDVLGRPEDPPSIEHVAAVRIGGTYSAASLHSRQDSRSNVGPGGSLASLSGHNLLERKNSENKTGGGGGGRSRSRSRSSSSSSSRRRRAGG